MIAYLNLRYAEGERVDRFRAGLRAVGYTDIRQGAGADGDLFCTWNRIGHADWIARQCESRGIPVLVAENRSWGNLVPGKWLHITRTRHNTAGLYPVGGPERWDGLGVNLAPFRPRDGERVILAQRGIGSPPTAQPRQWPLSVAGRLRVHPGRGTAKPLAEDLAKAGEVVTWGSAAAVEALGMGISVESHMPDWIGACDNTEAGRLAMLRRMAWAQWKPEEIADGTAFRSLL